MRNDRNGHAPGTIGTKSLQRFGDDHDLRVRCERMGKPQVICLPGLARHVAMTNITEAAAVTEDVKGARVADLL